MANALTWRTIRSAPKDGTQILLAEPDMRRGWVLYVGAWIDKPISVEGLGLRTWPTGWSAACIVTGDRGPFVGKSERYYWKPKSCIVFPSHWMPFPAAPTARISRALVSSMAHYDRNEAERKAARGEA